jgi:hypothetical protein
MVKIFAFKNDENLIYRMLCTMDGFMQHLLLEYHVLVLMVVLLGVNIIELVLGMMVTCHDYFKKNYAICRQSWSSC